MRSIIRRMRRASLAAFVALLALDPYLQPLSLGAAQPGPSAQAPKGTAAVTGAVSDATTGRPIGGAIVALEDRVPGSPRRSYSQVTTPTGRFAFVDLPASDTYFLTAGKPGFLDGGFGRSDPRGPTAPIALTDGQWLRDVRLTLRHPGSISGTVVDERGEPIVGAYVRVLPQVLVAGRAQWLAGPIAVTDDRGAYRIAGLGPGKYLVSVPSVQATLPASATIKVPTASAGTSRADLTASNEAAQAERLVVDQGDGQQLVVGRYAVPPPPAPDGKPTAYPIAFYPTASTPSNATPIELGISEDHGGVDLQLQPARTARVSGAVQGPPDAVGNLLLRLIPVGLEELGQGSEAATTVTLADGRFTFLDVPGGSYLLVAAHATLELTYTSLSNVRTGVPAPVPFPSQSASAGGIAAAPPGVEFQSLLDWRDQPYWGRLQVDLDGKDVDDVLLPLQRAVRMTGRFEWAPGAKASSNVPNIILEPADGRRSLGMPAPRFGGSATDFVIDGLMAGEYVLRTWLGGGAVESVTWDGQDYTDRPFDASKGRDFTGVIVTLTSASSSITGAVSESGVPLTSNAAVIAFPVERERWSNYGFTPTRLKSVLTTNDGRFRVDGLPAGGYYLVAVPTSQERAWLDPSFLARHASQATRVQIDRSDAKVAGVTLSLIK